jgi:hypothetical protein
MQGIHCVAHRTDLAIEVLSDLPLVSRVEKLLAGLYTYFSCSPKRHLELEKLCELLQVTGGKILNNVKTRWISMLPPLWRVLQEYCPLIIKHDELAKPTIKGSKKNYNMLADVRRLLSLAVILPLLQSIKNLIVFAQSSTINVCDFTRALNLCIMDIHDLYRDSSKAFLSDAFSSFKAICELSHDQLKMRWFTDLNDGSEHLVFEGHHGTKAGAHLNAMSLDSNSATPIFVTKEQWGTIVAEIKRDATGMLFH